MKTLFKDPVTKKESITVTALIVSFLVSFVTTIVLIIKLIYDKISTESIGFGFFTLSYLLIFVALYYKKRVRLSTDGFELSAEPNIKEEEA